MAEEGKKKGPVSLGKQILHIRCLLLHLPFKEEAHPHLKLV